MTEKLLRVRDISVTFGGVTAVQSVSFDMSRGEALGLIGPNGAGKSTLFNVVTGFVRPDRGSVEFNERKITNFPPHRINRLGLARSFQIMRLFLDMTVVENVMVGGIRSSGSIARAHHRALELLDLVGLHQKRSDLAGTLSTGQRKRLEMARALATRPSLLLLDEVFGGIDASTADALAEVIRKITAEGVAICLIDHNLEVLTRIVDRLICLHLGEILVEGKPHVVAESDAVAEAYLR